MRRRFYVRVPLITSLCLCACRASAAQQKPLTRTFVAGAEERYQVAVAIRVETHGVSTENIGDKIYASTFTHEAMGQVNWRSTRKILQVNPAGPPPLTNILHHFQFPSLGD